MPMFQSCPPPGQQLPPALGHFQLGGAAVVKVDCAAAYHPHRVPLLEREPCGLFLAAEPIASSSDCVGKSLFAIEVKRLSPA